MATQCPSKLIRNTLTTRDGATLSYFIVGSGPGLIILHGAMNDGHGHRELAYLLSSSYTVYLLSRRGRGGSAAFPDSVINIPALLPRPSGVDDEDQQVVIVGGVSLQRSYNREFSKAVLETELSDINLLLEKTRAEYILGVSTGAIIVLAACISPTTVPAASNIKKAVIFEPPLQFTEIDTGMNVQGIGNYEEDMAAGDVPGALVSAMKLVQLGPGWIPRVLMKFLIKLVIGMQERQKAKEEKGVEGKSTVSMASMAPILRYDFAVAEEMIGDLRRFEGTGKTREILLLTGDKSPQYLKVVIDELEKVIEDAKRITIVGVGHEVLCNPDVRGNPAKAIGAVKEFLA